MDLLQSEFYSFKDATNQQIAGQDQSYKKLLTDAVERFSVMEDKVQDTFGQILSENQRKNLEIEGAKDEIYQKIGKLLEIRKILPPSVTHEISNLHGQTLSETSKVEPPPVGLNASALELRNIHQKLDSALTKIKLFEMEF